MAELNDHIKELGLLREDIDALFRTVGKDLPATGIDALARARVSVSDAIAHVRTAMSAVGQRKTVS